MLDQNSNQPTRGPAPLTLSKNEVKADAQQYINKATLLIHSKETTANIQNMLTDNDPVKRIADLAVMIMRRLDSAARSAGVETRDSVKVIGAYAIVGLLVELAQAARKFTLNKDLQLLALTTALQDYFKAETQDGQIDPLKMKQSMGADITRMPPKVRDAAMQATDRIPLIAKQYNHGAGMDTTWKQGGAA